MKRPLLIFLLILLLSTCLCVEAQLRVTITSDAGNVVCVNTTITLTCVAANATEIKWTTGDHSEVTNNTIIVTATPESMQYTCIATDGDGNAGRSSISVIGNGSIPIVDEFNFNEDEIGYVGESFNLTVNFSPTVLKFTWRRQNAPIPDGYQIFNYSINEKNYSSLILFNMTTDDWGIYIFTANNHCGTSSVNVTLKIRADITCFSGPVPILSITPNQTTIRGEVITFESLFGGNYFEVFYSICWKIVSPSKIRNCVDDDSDVIGYVVTKPSQDCPPNNYSCCRFVSYLHINTSITSVPDETVITCNAVFKELVSSSSASNLTIINPPVLITGPHDVTVNLHETAEMTCTFTASQISYLSICAWSNENGHITPSDKYQIKQTPVSGRDNHMSCTVTVSNVTRIDEGKFCCYCYYNESFWKQYHVPEHTNISSLCGGAKLQLVKEKDDTSEIVEISVGSTLGTIIVILLILISVCTVWWVKRYRRKVLGYERIPNRRGSGAASTKGTEWGKVLENHRAKLCTDLGTVVDGIYNYLLNIIPAEERSDITTPQHLSNYKKVSVILDVIIKSNKKEHFEQFCKSLYEVNHANWAEELKSKLPS